MTQLILYTSEDGALNHAATVKESLTVQTEGAFKAYCHAPFDHFRGVTKLIGLGNRRGATP